MSFTRKKSRTLASGEVRDYFYRVENVWENGRPRQKVLEYLGTSPIRREVPIDPSLAGQLAQALMSGAVAAEDVRKVLKQLGVPVAGRVKQITLVYNPPLRKLTLRVE